MYIYAIEPIDPTRLTAVSTRTAVDKWQNRVQTGSRAVKKKKSPANPEIPVAYPERS